MGIVEMFSTRASNIFFCLTLLALLATGCQSGDGEHPPGPPAGPKNTEGQPPLKATAASYTITNNGTIYIITNTFGASYTITNRMGDTFTITNVGTVMTNAISTNGIILIVSTNVTYTSWKSTNTYTGSISFQWANSGCPKVRWLQFVSYSVLPTNSVTGNLPGNDPSAPPKKPGSWYVDTRPAAPDPFYDSNAGADNDALYDSPRSFKTLSLTPGAISVTQNFYTYVLCDTDIIFAFTWHVTCTRPNSRTYQFDGFIPGGKPGAVPGQLPLTVGEPPTTPARWSPQFPCAGW